MADEILKIDENHKNVSGAVTDDSNQFIKMLRIDDTTKGLKVSVVGGGGSGTVTSVSQGTGILLSTNPIVATGSVSLATSLQPIATLAGNSLKVLRVNVGETAVEYATPNVGTVTIVSVTTANGVSGSVATATTTPAITLTLGAITPTTVNGLTITANGTNTLNITAGKTLAVTQSLTLSGTDSTVMTFPTTTATIARTDAGQTFTGVQVFTTPTITTANLSGAQQLAENASIQLDAVLSADGKYSGTTIAGTAGATLAFGDLVYLAVADTRWELTDADAAATSGGILVGMCVLAAANDGDPTLILLNGNIRADAKFPALTVGAAVYASTTPGEIQVAQPSGTDDVIRVVGFALTADSIVLNVSPDYITHT